MKQAQGAARLIFLAFGLGISSWAPMVPFAKERLGLDDAELGMILFLFGLGALGTMPLTGWLVHRFGSCRLTAISGVFASACLPFLAIASTPFFLSLILFLFGAATGALNVSINAQAVAIESKSEKHLMSGLHCLFSTGGLLGALLVTALLELNFSLLFSASAISFIMLVLILTKKHHLLSFQKENDGRLATPKGRFGFPGFNILFLGMICFLAFVAEGSMLDWSAEFLHSTLDYDPAFAGIGYAIFSISMAFGRLFGDRLIQRFNVFIVFQVGSFLAACGFVMVVYLGLNYCELLGFCLIGLGASNVVPILFSSSGRMGAASPGFALTIVTTLGYVGSLLGPAFIGFLAQATSLNFAFASIAFLLTAVGLTGRFVVIAPSFNKSEAALF